MYSRIIIIPILLVSLDICNVNEGSDKGQMGITFQVADVVKPLISVKRLVEKGNYVSFGPEESDNFIENKPSTHPCSATLLHAMRP